MHPSGRGCCNVISSFLEADVRAMLENIPSFAHSERMPMQVINQHGEPTDSLRTEKRTPSKQGCSLVGC